MHILDEQEFAKKLREDTLRDLLYFAQHVTFKDRDERAVILVGHLLLEEQVTLFVHRKLAHPKKIAAFKFYQILRIAEAMNEHPSTDWAFSACGLLAALRNDASHKLEFAGLEPRVREFVTFVRSHSQVTAIDLGISCNLSEFRFALLSVYSVMRNLNRDYALRVPTLLSSLLVRTPKSDEPNI